MDAEALARVRAAYDAVAPAYAEQFLRELDAKPFDRALLAGFAELVRGEGKVAELGTGSGHVALGFHLGDERFHVEEWLGARVALDWRFFPMAVVAGALEAAGLAVEARVERAPYANEYPTQRGYVLARKKA